MKKLFRNIFFRWFVSITLTVLVIFLAWVYFPNLDIPSRYIPIGLHLLRIQMQNCESARFVSIEELRQAGLTRESFCSLQEKKELNKLHPIRTIHPGTNPTSEVSVDLPSGYPNYINRGKVSEILRDEAGLKEDFFTLGSKSCVSLSEGYIVTRYSSKYFRFSGLYKKSTDNSLQIVFLEKEFRPPDP
jgi:hypothetical protein